MHRFDFHKRVAAAIFLFGVIASLLLSGYIERLYSQRDEMRFDSIAVDAVGKVSAAVNLINYGLGGANGVFAASATVEHDEFREYVASRNLEVEFPGVIGFGFTQFVKREELAAFLKAARADNQPKFEVKTSGQNPNLFITRFLEPEDPNRPAHGYDIGSELSRREAAEIAMRSGKPAITKRIELLQVSKREAGFLYLRPVYKRGMPTGTAAEREKAIFGWVYAAFTLDRVLAPIEQTLGNLATLSVYEETSIGEDQRIYTTSSDDSIPKLEKILDVEIGQRRWRVKVTPKSTFFNRDASYVVFGVLVIGLLFAVIVSGVVWFYLEAKQRAISLRLREGEQFIKGIVDSANFSIIVTEPNGTIKLFNRAATRMLGYRPDELIGKHTPAIIHDPQEVAEQAVVISEKLQQKIAPGFEVFVAAARRHLSDQTEWTYIRKDGTRFPVELSVSAMRDEKGEIIAFMGIASDISERKRAERELRQSEERFKTSFYHASHGIALVGLDGRWLKVNPALCQMFGYEEQALLKKTVGDITFADDLAHERELVSQILAGKVEKYELEKRFMHRDGHVVWTLSSVAFVRDEDGNLMLFVVQIQDITVQKAAESELKNKTAELMYAKEAAINAGLAKSQFLANMSHEIRTPLTSIIGYSELLITESLTGNEKQSALETIIKNGNHLLGIINDILDLSKIEAGKLDVEIAPVDLAELVSDVCNLMKHRAAEKGLALGFEYSFPIPRRIMTDSIRLKQILINLVGNAVKFTSTGGVKVQISFDHLAQSLEFSVIDTGTGIPPEQRSRLFEAFSQGDTSITRKFGGTGLGLLVSSQLAQKLGGSIALESEPGKGSVFKVTIATGKVSEQELTYSIEQRSTQAPSEKVEDAPKLYGKILVAEDGEDNRGLISFLLKKLGVTFVIVENGAQAVEALSRDHFDLVLMDVQMPIMDGYTAAKTIRQQGMNMPIIALTANAMKSDIEAALANGCNDFLGKPFTRSDFVRKLSYHLPKVAEQEGGALVTSDETIALIDDDPDMLHMVISIVRNLPKRYEDLQRLYRGGEWKQLSMLAHSARGATGSLGFNSIASALGEIEEASARGDTVATKAAMEKFKHLVVEAQKINYSIKLAKENQDHGK